MTVYFDRQYQLIIGRPYKLTQTIIPSSIAGISNLQMIMDGTNNYSGIPAAGTYGEIADWNSVPADWYEVTDLQMSAEIKQTKSTGTPCTIFLDNLTDDQVAKIKQDDLVILRAGYRAPNGEFIQTSVGVGREQFGDLFVGQVVQVVTTQELATKTTKIVCGESITVKKNSKVSKSWPPFTTRMTVLKDLINLLKTQGVPLGRFGLTQANSAEWELALTPLLSGLSIKGYLVDELEKFADSIGLRVYTATGKLYIESKYAPQGQQIFKVTPDNVKGTIQPLSDNSGKKSNDNGSAIDSSIQVTFWCNADIAVDKILSLTGFDNDLNGEYIIETVGHKLDYRSKNTWDTTVTAKRLQG